MKLGLYPGCSFEGSAREYAESLQAIAPKLGLEMEEISEWNCCGASSAHSVDHLLSLALPAKIIAQAEQQKIDELLVPCAACYNRLASTKTSLAGNAHEREAVSDLTKMPYSGSLIIRNILEVLNRYVTAEKVKSFPKTFSHKVVCYYGCLLVRPKSIVNHSRMEDPMEMDDLMKRIGATPLDWAMKTECCGASFSITRTDIVGNLGGKILEDAENRGAEAIIVACPMCHSNLDMRRKEIERTTKRKFKIPIVYITQAIGIALGLEPGALGIQRHFVPVALEGKNKEPQNAPARTAAAIA